MQDFNFKRDFRLINWKSTLWVNLLRAFAAGLVFGIGIQFSGKPELAMLIAAPLGWPFLYLIMGIPIGLLCSFLGSRNVPFTGLIGLFFDLMFTIIGDPLVWILSRVAPKAVPVEKFGFINFSLILWVVDPPKEQTSHLKNRNIS